MKNFTKKIFLFLSVILITSNIFSQNSVVKWKVGKESMPGNLKSFQENKGQFINFVNDWQIFYGTDYEGSKTLFTNHGVIYTLPEVIKDSSNSKEGNEHEIRKKIIYHNVSIEWKNSNPNLTIEPVDESPYYFGSIDPKHPNNNSIDYIKGFGKLIYHNVYPNIDIEYTFHKEKGIEYTIIMRPGSNISDFKMLYSGQENIFIKNDDVHIKTPIGDIIDHAPITLQNGFQINSSFTQSNNEISFNLGNYDKTKELIIDPWTVSPTILKYLPGDIGMDGSNNTYVYGAGTDTYVQKYSTTGVLAWTYTLVQYGGFSGYISDMAVDVAGNTYVPGPYPYTNGAGGYYSMVCLNTAGALKYFNNTNATTTPTMFEVWNVAYSCDYSELVEAGSPTVEQEQVAVVNSINGNIGGETIKTTIGEIYAGCMAPNGNYYAIGANPCFGCSTPGDDIVCYTIAAGTATFSWSKQSLYQWNDFDTKNPDGIATNGIGASCAYLYTSDGKSLDQRNLANGNVIKTVTIPGGTNTDPSPSGIGVDMACGYVYVGTPTSVQIYDQNLNTVTSQATPYEVRDVCYNNGLVSACGGTGTSSNDFVMQFTAQLCTTALTITHTNTSCGLNNGTATVATPTFCTGPYTYVWSPGGMTTQTVTGLAAGIYTVNVGTSSSCVTVSDTVTIKPSTAETVTATPTGGCSGSITTTVVGGVPGYTYLWSNGATTSNITGVSAGSYTITVTDASGCVKTATAIVVGSAITVTTTPTNPLCNGGTGTIITTVVGAGTFTYLWSNGLTTSNITATAGSYTVTVTSSGGCTGTSTSVITQPTAVTFTTSFTPSNCSSNDGSAIINVAGGTPGYTYLWSSGQTTSSINNVGPGTYTVVSKDLNGCTITTNITIPSTGAVITSILTPTNVLCNGNKTGNINITGTSGGTAPYTYLWSTGQTGTIATPLSAGTYTVTIADNNGCIGTETSTITQPSKLEDSTVSITNILCNGNNTGSATVGVNGGTKVYTYLWNSGQTTPTINNLTIGTYTLTVTDADGCITTDTVIITQPTPLKLTASGFNTTCNGICNGQAAVIPSGGIIPYTYLWSTTAVTPGITNLCIGAYKVQVTDNNGCVHDTTVNVNQPTAISITKSSINAHCNQSDGSANVTVAGGTPGYKYLWSNGNTTTSITNISSGTYCITVTDFNNCVDSVCFIIGNIPGEIISITTTPTSCNGGTNGTAIATVVGGIVPYTYLWTNGQTSNKDTLLSFGTYTLTVTDSSGCPSTAIATITQPTPVITTTIGNQTICIGQTATISANCTGGTPNYFYSWNSGCSTSSCSVSPIITTTYTVITKDQNGCLGPIDSVKVIVNPPLSIVVGPNQWTCPGGIVNLTSSGSGGDGVYTYSWTPSTGLSCTTCQNPSSNTTSNTTYTVTISDACGTPIAIDTIKVIMDPVPVVNFKGDTLSGCYPLCVNFTDLTIGNNISSWSWTFGNGNTSSIQNPQNCYTSAGTFTVGLIVTSDSGCVSSTTIPNMISTYSYPVANFISSPQPTTIITPTITFTDQSTDSYGIKNWLWTFSDTNSISVSQNTSRTYSDTGSYCATLIVTNIHGCTDTITHCVIVEPFFTLYIPNAFTPNGDGKDDFFTVKGEYICGFQMYIFDRWGMQLYYTEDINKGWDGRVNGGSKICQEDTYVYLIYATDCIENKKHSYIGKISILK